MQVRAAGCSPVLLAAVASRRPALYTVPAQASGHLLEAVRQSMRHVAPYCTALGLGDVAAPFDSVAGASPPPQPPYGAALDGGLVAGAGRGVGSVESRWVLARISPGFLSAWLAFSAVTPCSR